VGDPRFVHSFIDLIYTFSAIESLVLLPLPPGYLLQIPDFWRPSSQAAHLLNQLFQTSLNYSLSAQSGESDDSSNVKSCVDDWAELDTVDEEDEYWLAKQQK
jgi:hypothetical protein